MAVKTRNSYGRISVSNDAIAKIVVKTCLDCYGVVEMASKRPFDKFLQLAKKNKFSKGVKISTVDNKISIDLSVTLKYGVNISAVAETIKKNVKYAVEEWTGMIVQKVNVCVLGVKR